MVDMPTIESMRDMGRQGLANAEIQRRTGASRPTIRKHLAMDDFSPQMPAKPRRGSTLDPHKPFIGSILEGDLHVWRKQRHSARRIYERPLDETPYAGGCGTVKKRLRERKAQMRASETAFVEPVWAPGEAQADFGDVDVAYRGERVSLPGAQGRVRARGRRAAPDRVRRRRGGRPQDRRQGHRGGAPLQDAHALRVLGDLRQPGSRPREGQRRAQGRLVAPAPVHAGARAGRHRGVRRGAVGKTMLARIGGFGLGPAPDVGPGLSACDGLLGCDAA